MSRSVVRVHAGPPAKRVDEVEEKFTPLSKRGVHAGPPAKRVDEVEELTEEVEGTIKRDCSGKY
jgi:hypothetical protein